MSLDRILKQLGLCRISNVIDALAELHQIKAWPRDNDYIKAMDVVVGRRKLVRNNPVRSFREFL